MKILGHIMKDVWVTNKIGIYGVMFFKKFENLAFGGLGELSNSSLATEKPDFQKLTVFTRDHVNHWKPIDHIFL